MALAAEDLYKLGSNLLLEGNPVEALHQLELAKDELDSDYGFSVTLGRAFMELGRHDEAVERFRHSVDLAPDRPEAFHYWAISLQRRGKKEDARKIQLQADARADKIAERAKRTDEPTPNWKPEATAIKSEDIEFECPNCQIPILHGSSDFTCPNCRQNLLPIRHGRIKPHWRMDGVQDFQCAHCEMPLSGKELTCPHCEYNLMTGEPPEPEKLTESVQPRRTMMKSPKGIAILIVGFLLLTIGIGQLRNPRTYVAARYYWALSLEKAHLIRGYEREAMAPKEKIYQKNLTSVKGDQQMLNDFLYLLLFLFTGGFAIVIGGLKLYFDR